MTTKISEQIHWTDNDKRMVVQETHDFTPVVEKAKALKSAGVGDLGKENKLVGLVPMKMWHEWAKKWGVKASDTDAMKKVLARELMDSDNAHLRVWDGNF